MSPVHLTTLVACVAILGCSSVTPPVNVPRPCNAATEPRAEVVPVKDDVVAPAAEAPPSDWDPMVLELFELSKRDAAIRALVARGKYDGEPAYREESVGHVKEVVACPAPTGRTMVSVFLQESYSEPDESPRTGHYVLVRSDGTLIPVPRNANSLHGYFGDLNGDGVVESAEAQLTILRGVEVNALRITSMTEAFPEPLVVLWPRKDWSFRVWQPDPEKLAVIQLYSASGKTQKVLAEYRWDRLSASWQGPSGSARDGFLRVTGDEEEAARKLAKPSCRWLAEELVSELPEVKHYLDAGGDARPGGLEDANEPGLVEFRKGFHHDDYFEALIFVTITQGRLEVTGPLGPLQVPAAVEAEVYRACH